MPAEEPAFLLLRQGSNLNFSDPESDVLPITPRSNLEGQIYIKLGKITSSRCLLLVACCWLEFDVSLRCYSCCSFNVLKIKGMSNYRDLEIYQIAFALAKRVHIASLILPQFELYEQGSQIRRSSKSIKDQIAEGYGRRRYKPEFIKFLIYSQSSCDETTSQLGMIIELYPDLPVFQELLPEYENLGKKINNFIQYVETSWRT